MTSIMAPRPRRQASGAPRATSPSPAVPSAVRQVQTSASAADRTEGGRRQRDLALMRQAAEKAKLFELSRMVPVTTERLDGWVGTGDFEVHMVSVPLPREKIERLLPPGFTIDDSILGHGDTYPLLINFGRQHNVKANPDVFNAHSSKMRWAIANTPVAYDEVTIGIPFVKNGPNDAPSTYISHIYVNDEQAREAGEGFRFPKVVERIDIDRNESPMSGFPEDFSGISRFSLPYVGLEAKVKKLTPDYKWREVPGFDAIKKIADYPMIAGRPNDCRYSQMTWKFDAVGLEEVTLSPDFFRDRLGVQLDGPIVATGYAGKVGWKLSDPFE